MAEFGVYVFWAGYFLLSMVCQLVAGDFPHGFFVFPANAAVMLLWMAVLWVLFREKRNSWLVSTLLSRKSTFVLLGVFTAACIIQGLSSEKYTVSWWFVAAVFGLLSHLYLVILRGMSGKRPFRLRFFLNHAGVFLAIAAGFFGSPDTEEWRTVASIGGPAREAVDADGRVIALDYDIRLTGFYIDSYAGGVPRSYEAAITVDEDKDFLLRVNHPHRLSWQDDLYLSGVGNFDGNVTGKENCILQIVRQPWKYVEFTGILMLLSGCLLLFLQGPAGRSAESGKAMHERSAAAGSGRK